MLEGKGSMGRPWACHQQHANHVALLVPFWGKAGWPVEWEIPSHLTFLPHTLNAMHSQYTCTWHP